MPVAAARPIVLRAAERERLKRMAYGHKTEHRPRMRAKVVPPAARGRSNARITRETGLHLDTVRCRPGRFAAHGLGAPSGRERSGRPPALTALQVAEVKAPACRLPAETGTPLSRGSCPELAREAMDRGIATFVSVLRDEGSLRREPPERSPRRSGHRAFRSRWRPGVEPARQLPGASSRRAQ
ncbi:MULTISPECIES: hypothetical protein [Streptomyces]|uniref:Helix-turn-helix domain-containing protein n=1 Tax=Streptomyces sp. 900129855 TaxID=3155129 RepID=A0ABV2ZHL3_9ACTN